MHPARILLPFGLAYFTSHWFRCINAVIAPDLVREFALSPSDLGMLSSAYFVAFASFQLPLGILLDRYGPRRVQMVLMAIAATGALLFTLGQSLLALTLARALVGIGVAAGLMAPIKAILSWFSSERTAAMTGWIFVLGFTGAIAATAPAHLLLQWASWRGLFVIVAALCGLALIALWRYAPEPPAHARVADTRGAWQSFWRIYRHPNFWRLSIVSMTSQAVALGEQTLWAGPWLRDVAQLDRGAAANVLLASVVASALGSFAFGQLGSRLARRGHSILAALIAGVIVFVLIQLALIGGWSSSPYTLWILYGFFSTAGSLVFAVVTRDFDPSLSGRVLTALNVLIFGLAFICQWGIGAIINLWPSTDAQYHPDGYRAGFAAFLALELAALLYFAWMQRSITKR